MASELSVFSASLLIWSEVQEIHEEMIVVEGFKGCSNSSSID